MYYISIIILIIPILIITGMIFYYKKKCELLKPKETKTANNRVLPRPDVFDNWSIPITDAQLFKGIKGEPALKYRKMVLFDNAISGIDVFDLLYFLSFLKKNKLLMKMPSVVYYVADKLGI